LSLPAALPICPFSCRKTSFRRNATPSALTRMCEWTMWQRDHSIATGSKQMADSVSRPRSRIVMGVAGCGKSTLAHALAQQLGVRYVDADAYHSPENVRKMAQGEALTDDDRADWLLAMRLLWDDADRSGQAIVLACSALKQAYRDVLGASPSTRPLVYIR